METKLFEIRDRMTMIVALGVLMSPNEPSDALLLTRAGYGPSRQLVLLTQADGGLSHYDPYEWAGRTMTTAHRHIEEHWHELKSGAVVDVEYILGESTEPKRSEVRL